MNAPLVSFCIPTNGVIEWVVPVLNSIYSQDQAPDLFEVIVTDNGNSKEFAEIMMNFSASHYNFIYKRTDAKMFLNQIEAFKLANGDLIKFVNHRMLFLPGAVEYFINYSNTNRDKKPITYFANGMLKTKKEVIECMDFDEYVRKLSYWSSWSAGTAIWKSYLQRLDLNMEFDTLFPHLDLIFLEKSRNDYRINNKVVFKEIRSDITKKGQYNLFYAFSCAYIEYFRKLKMNKWISNSTYFHVKYDTMCFMASLYSDFIILKNSSSYDLRDSDKYMRKYYNPTCIKALALIYTFKKILRSVLH